MTDDTPAWPTDQGWNSSALIAVWDWLEADVEHDGEAIARIAREHDLFAQETGQDLYRDGPRLSAGERAALIRAFDHVQSRRSKDANDMLAAKRLKGEPWDEVTAHLRSGAGSPRFLEVVADLIDGGAFSPRSDLEPSEDSNLAYRKTLVKRILAAAYPGKTEKLISNLASKILVLQEKAADDVVRKKWPDVKRGKPKNHNQILKEVNKATNNGADKRRTLRAVVARVRTDNWDI